MAITAVFLAQEGVRAQTAPPDAPASMRQLPPQNGEELADHARHQSQAASGDVASLEVPLSTLSRGQADGEQEAPDQLLLTFRPGSAELTPSATRLLDAFGRGLAQFAPGSLAIELAAHGDGVGPRDLDLDLARRRALAASVYLEQDFGLSPDQISVSVSRGRAGHRGGVGQLRLILAAS